jgi:hypothetical protein
MVCLVLSLQVGTDLMSPVPDLNIGNTETDVKEEEDPLLITFHDLQENNEVCIHIRLSAFRSGVWHCICSSPWPSLRVCCCVDNWWIIHLEFYHSILAVLNIYTVEPRFTNATVHEQFGSRTNFPSKKRLGWRTRKLATAASWEYRRGSVSCWLTLAQYTSVLVFAVPSRI